MGADQTADPQGGQLLSLLRRHMAALILLAILGAAGGVGLAIVMPPPYKATATVLVSPLEGNPYSPEGRGDDLVNLQTEAQLVSTDKVSKIVERKLGYEPDGEVEVSVPPNTQVLNLTYTSTSASRARKGAQAFADAYLEYRSQRAQAVVNNQLAKLKAQAVKVEQQLTQANQQLAAASGSQRATLQQRVTAYTNQLGVIDEQANDLASTPIDPGQVITPADAPSGPGLVQRGLYGGGGLVLGLFAGFVIILLRERLNQRLRNAESVEGLGIRALSTIPPGGPTGDSLALVSAPKSPAGEAYRRLRAAVVATAPQTPVAILVTNATPGGSARLASANLAVSLAFAGAKTIMIDANTDDADMTGLFGARPGKGLSDTLLSGTDPATLLIHTDSQLRLLPRGPRALEAAHRFSGPRMRETVKVLRRRSEYLIVNAASIHDADAQALCTFMDAVVLVVNQGVTTREELRQAYVEAERAGVTVLGTVLEPPEQGRRRKSSSSSAPSSQHRQARAPRGVESRAPEARAPESRGGGDALAWADDFAESEDDRHRDPAADAGYWSSRKREDDEPAGDPATLTTQALPQIKPQTRSAEARQGGSRGARRSGSRHAAPPAGGRRAAPPLESPPGPGTPVAPKPISPTDITQDTGTGRSARHRAGGLRSEADPSDPASDGRGMTGEHREGDAGSPSARTQEDVSKYMRPDLSEDRADGAAGEKADLVPRYGKNAHKAGRHAGP